MHLMKGLFVNSVAVTVSLSSSTVPSLNCMDICTWDYLKLLSSPCALWWIWWFVFGGVGCLSLRKVRAGSRSSEPVLVNSLFFLKADSNITLDIINFLPYMWLQNCSEEARSSCVCFCLGGYSYYIKLFIHFKNSNINFTLTMVSLACELIRALWKVEVSFLFFH